MPEGAPSPENSEDIDKAREHQSFLTDAELDTLFEQQVYENISESIRQRDDYIALDDALETETAQNLLEAGEYKLLADAIIQTFNERVGDFSFPNRKPGHSADHQWMDDVGSLHRFLSKADEINPSFAMYATKAFIGKVLLRIPTKVDGNYKSYLYSGVHVDNRGWGLTISQKSGVQELIETSLQLPEVRTQVDQVIATNLQSGNFSIVSDFAYSQKFDLTDIWKDPTIIKAAKERLLRAMRDGTYHDNMYSDRWVLEQIYPDGFGQDEQELEQAAKQGILTKIGNGFSPSVGNSHLPTELPDLPGKLWGQYVYHNKRDLFSSAELEGFVTKGVINALENGVPSNAKMFIHMLPREEGRVIKASPQTIEAAKTGIINQFGRGQFYIAKEIAVQFLDKNDPFFITEIRRVVPNELVKLLERGDFTHVRVLASILPQQESEALMASAEVIGVAKSSMVASLQQGNIQQAVGAADEFLAKHPTELSEAWKTGLTDFATDDQRFAQLIKNRSVVPDMVFAQVGLAELDSYIHDLGYSSLRLFRDYQTLKKNNNAMLLEGFIHNIKNLTETIVSSKSTPESMIKNEYYAHTIQTLFPNNAGGYTTYESNQSCEDRTKDLERYSFREKYRINLGEGVALQLRSGMAENEQLVEEAEAPLTNFEREVVADEAIAKSRTLSLALESLAGRKETSEVRAALLLLEDSRLQGGLERYITDLKAQAADAKNPRVAYLQLLREFYSDQMKEVAREVAEAGLSDQAPISRMPQYFSEASAFRSDSEQRAKLSSLQPQKAGLTDPFLAQLMSTLERAGGGGKKAFSLYERDDTGSVKLDKNGDLILGSKGKALASIIEKQSGRVADIMETIAGERPSAADIHIGRFSIEKLMQSTKQLTTGEYDQALFQAYIETSLQGMFQSEVDLIDNELRKYEPANTAGEGRRAKQIDMFFTKNKASAHARATGGVCVSGDNPNRGEKNIWDLPNFFQLVLQDPESKQCQGLVLLHEVNDGGKKILSASYNPSSTYLYTVDETQLFSRLTDVLSTFAQENQFDALAVSKNPQIRTNRTGGTFEQAMNQRIAKVKTQLPLSESHDFSYYPSNYKLEGSMDVLWQKEGSQQQTAPFVSAEEADTL